MSVCTGFYYGDTSNISHTLYILHYLKDPKLWELSFIPYNGQCRVYIINRMFMVDLLEGAGDLVSRL